MKTIKAGILFLVLSFSFLTAAPGPQTPGKSFAASPQTWVDLGSGMGYFNWTNLIGGIAAKTDSELYRSTYLALANKNPANSLFNSQAAADAMRKNAEQRLRDTLGLLREHDPEFFDRVMQEHGLALLNNSSAESHE